jgi:hypothetical protein
MRRSLNAGTPTPTKSRRRSHARHASPRRPRYCAPCCPFPICSTRKTHCESLLQSRYRPGSYPCSNEISKSPSFIRKCWRKNRAGCRRIPHRMQTSRPRLRSGGCQIPMAARRWAGIGRTVIDREAPAQRPARALEQPSKVSDRNSRFWIPPIAVMIKTPRGLLDTHLTSEGVLEPVLVAEICQSQSAGSRMYRTLLYNKNWVRSAGFRVLRPQ